MSAKVFYLVLLLVQFFLAVTQAQEVNPSPSGVFYTSVGGSAYFSCRALFDCKEEQSLASGSGAEDTPEQPGDRSSDLLQPLPESTAPNCSVMLWSDERCIRKVDWFFNPPLTPWNPHQGCHLKRQSDFNKFDGNLFIYRLGAACNNTKISCRAELDDGSEVHSLNTTLILQGQLPAPSLTEARGRLHLQIGNTSPDLITEANMQLIEAKSTLELQWTDPFTFDMDNISNDILGYRIRLENQGAYTCENCTFAPASYDSTPWRRLTLCDRCRVPFRGNQIMIHFTHLQNTERQPLIIKIIPVNVVGDGIPLTISYPSFVSLDNLGVNGYFLEYSLMSLMNNLTITLTSGSQNEEVAEENSFLDQDNNWVVFATSHSEFNLTFDYVLNADNLNLLAMNFSPTQDTDPVTDCPITKSTAATTKITPQSEGETTDFMETVEPTKPNSGFQTTASVITVLLAAMVRQFSN